MIEYQKNTVAIMKTEYKWYCPVESALRSNGQK